MSNCKFLHTADVNTVIAVTALPASGQRSILRRYMSLNDRLGALPTELQDIILTELLWSLLHHGKVHPKELEDEDNHDNTNHARPGIVDMLQGIPSSWLKKAHDIFYGMNTWVVAGGNWMTTICFFLRLPELDVSRIVSIELTFDWRDTLYTNAAVWNRAWYTAAAARLKPDGQLSVRDALSQVIDQPPVTVVAVQNWTQKLWTIKSLPLQHLKLDFSKMSNFVPYTLSDFVSCNQPFTYGQPRHLEIVAPTPGEGAAILMAIQGWNVENKMSPSCTLCRGELH